MDQKKISSLNLYADSLLPNVLEFLREDDFHRNMNVLAKMPMDVVCAKLKIKSDLVLAGMPWFVAAFKSIHSDFLASLELLNYEGHELKKGSEIEFKLPFGQALLGERVALNLLTHASKVATTTKKFVDIAGSHGIKILDTRKTTPGLKGLEKYAVSVGGGYNHRFAQADMFMIKDNHKHYFGGIEAAYDFFKSLHAFYVPVLAEIHSIDELKVALKIGIKHIMLDNFSPNDICEAMKYKKDDMTFEVSGGVNLENIHEFMIKGVDAISIGALTHSPLSVDISLKYYR